jgi:hypothetical protein
MPQHPKEMQQCAKLCLAEVPIRLFPIMKVCVCVDPAMLEPAFSIGSTQDTRLFIGL